MKINKETFEKLKILGHALIDDKGREMLSNVPVVLDAGLKPPLTLQEQIRRILRQEVSRQADEQGMETFEESQDFDIDDGFDTPEVQSRYEVAVDEIPIERGKDDADNDSKVVAKPDQSGDDSVDSQDGAGSDQASGKVDSD